MALARIRRFLRECVSGCASVWVLAQHFLGLHPGFDNNKEQKPVKKCHKIWVHALHPRITIIAKLCRWKILKKWFSFKLAGKLSSYWHTHTHTANEGVKKVLETRPDPPLEGLPGIPEHGQPITATRFSGSLRNVLKIKTPWNKPI